VALRERLPPAVRIAAARLRHRSRWTVMDLVERLRAERQRSSELILDDRDLAAVFSLSYEHLTPRRTTCRARTQVGEPPPDDILAVGADHRRGHELGRGHQYMTAVPPEFQA
jgi:hypothetical protein